MRQRTGEKSATDEDTAKQVKGIINSNQSWVWSVLSKKTTFNEKSQLFKIIMFVLLSYSIIRAQVKKFKAEF